MASLSNSRWQNHKEHPNRSINNGYIIERAKFDVVGEGGMSNYKKWASKNLCNEIIYENWKEKQSRFCDDNMKRNKQTI